MIIRLMGGLGNQMHQYAYGCYLQDKGVSVLYNVDWFKRFKNRQYGLNYFNCDVIVTDKPYTESGDHGRYHYLKYTEPVKGRMEKEFTLNTEPIDAVGVHVRRGDYVGHPRFINLGLDYYTKAIKMMGGKEVYIFSDDLDWCRKNFPQEFVYVDYPDYICFDMLRRCTKKIIANSTFSWWAAYLGEGNVIAPSKWFTDPAKQKRAINQIPVTWQKQMHERDV